MNSSEIFIINGNKHMSYIYNDQGNARDNGHEKKAGSPLFPKIFKLIEKICM